MKCVPGRHSTTYLVENLLLKRVVGRHSTTVLVENVLLKLVPGMQISRAGFRSPVPNVPLENLRRAGIGL